MDRTFAGAVVRGWKVQPVSLRTRWAAASNRLTPGANIHVRKMVRPTWENLNGLWGYAITPKDASAPEHYAGHILVPYPVEHHSPA